LVADDKARHFGSQCLDGAARSLHALLDLRHGFHGVAPQEVVSCQLPVIRFAGQRFDPY
jgi:hypothetical protein